MNPLLDQFREFYRELDQSSIAGLGQIYRDDIEFCDPVHCTQGLAQLQRYFASTMQNVDYCAFDIADMVQQDDSAVAVWTMRLRHPRLQRGETIEVPGTSHLRFDQRIYYHRDYFDLGAMLYEHIPLIGGAVRSIKRRMIDS
jgi:limonene-1,2-epoxide hydrolase